MVSTLELIVGETGGSEALDVFIGVPRRALGVILLMSNSNATSFGVVNVEV